jgi:hypothetical protein
MPLRDKSYIKPLFKRHIWFIAAIIAIAVVGCVTWLIYDSGDKTEVTGQVRFVRLEKVVPTERQLPQSPYSAVFILANGRVTPEFLCGDQKTLDGKVVRLVLVPDHGCSHIHSLTVLDQNLSKAGADVIHDLRRGGPPAGVQQSSMIPSNMNILCPPTPEQNSGGDATGPSTFRGILRVHPGLAPWIGIVPSPHICAFEEVQVPVGDHAVEMRLEGFDMCEVIATGTLSSDSSPHWMTGYMLNSAKAIDPVQGCVGVVGTHLSEP